MYMAYSVDLRRRAIDFLNEGHTQEETGAIFKVGVSTIKRWLALLSETGNLENRPLNRSASKFDSEKLKTYIEENPDAFLKEIAEHFGGSITGAFYALAREKITYKKKSLNAKNATRKRAPNMMRK
jgi:transposase